MSKHNYILFLVFFLGICNIPYTLCLTEPPFFDPEVSFKYLEDLQLIALENDDTRAVGTTGFNDSAIFVYDMISKNTNFDVEYQFFTISSFSIGSSSMFKQVTPTEINYRNGIDFITLTYSGKGDVTSLLQLPSNDLNNDGCNSDDFDFIKGNIAIIPRGNCDFNMKVENAVSKGAVGVLIMNYENQGIASGTLGNMQDVPVFMITYSLGSTLLELPNNQFNMFANTSVETTYTANVIATSKEGDPNSKIVSGSHLDSVPAGPGINDNGSGTSSNLALALHYYELLQYNQQQGLPKPVNQVQFAWFAGEELGLLGSKHYVQSLGNDTSSIGANLNFDMLASPNYFSGIYYGNDAKDPIKYACTAIQLLFEEYYINSGLPFDYTTFDGRSDYGPFIEVDIPAGGLFSGAEKKKSIEQVEKYGGVANEAYDECYHRKCDDLLNINTECLYQMANAANFVLKTLAYSDLDVLFGNNSLRNYVPDKNSKIYDGPSFRNPSSDYKKLSKF
eukprot:TRINITY_DN4691_c0_g1_i1.p1 TRINITY_DN4691_c0_g1~~TRINITY_DN4691_c0_g1_i1.p1  ORF type:complete len:505 (-),score=182.07 TRINITY_DN4691_c0_g1_i1:95-1609(-)